METRNCADLSSLLENLFDNDELGRWIYENIGPDIYRGLPRNVSPSQLAFHTVRILERHGWINRDFWTALERSRPQHIGRIREVAKHWPASPTLISKTNKRRAIQTYRRFVILVAAALCIAIIPIAAIIWIISASNISCNPTTPHRKPEKRRAIPPEDRTKTPPSQADMVLVSGGRFTMGSTAEEIDAAVLLCRQSYARTPTVAGQKRRTRYCQDTMRSIYNRERAMTEVEVAPFFIDRYEVRNRDFAAWLSGKTMDIDRGMVLVDNDLWIYLPDGHSGIIRTSAHTFRALSVFADAPVNRVTWAGASAYCRDHGKRLPKQAEWAFAARGSERRRFPWGEELPTCSQVVFARAPEQRCANDVQSEPLPLPVGSGAYDITPEGVRDLGGSVSEWIADSINEQPKRRMIRGGNWAGGIEWLRAAGRGIAATDEARPNIGFRCAMSASQFSKEL